MSTESDLPSRVNDEFERLLDNPVTLRAVRLMTLLDDKSVGIGVTKVPSEFIEKYFAPLFDDPNLDVEAIANAPSTLVDSRFSVLQNNFLRIVGVACACAAETISAEMNDEHALAIDRLAMASYWGGIAAGFLLVDELNRTADALDASQLGGLPERQESAADYRLQEILRSLHRSRSSAGGQGRANRYKPVKDWVRKAFRQGRWPSARQAAKALAPEAFRLSVEKGCGISEDRAFDTVYGWIRDEQKRPAN